MEQDKKFQKNLTRLKNFNTYLCVLFDCYWKNLDFGKKTCYQATYEEKLDFLQLFYNFLILN